MSAPVTLTYGKAFVVTPSDGTNYTTAQTPSGLARALYVGGTGAATIVLLDDSTVLVSAIPVGTVLPITHKRVNSTGTTATLLVALCDG